MDAYKGIQVLRQRYDYSLEAGFTGTRRGMTIDQWRAFEHLYRSLEEERKILWHDGDCVGADDQAHATVLLKKANTFTIGHPCNLKRYRAHNEFDDLRAEKPPLVRNKDIVNESDVMFAAPGEYDEQFRGSGTWATIRYARETKTPLFIIWPDGTTTVEMSEDE